MQSVFDDAVVNVAHSPQGRFNGLVNLFDNDIILGVLPGNWNGFNAHIAEKVLKGSANKSSTLVVDQWHRSRVPHQLSLLDSIHKVDRTLLIAANDLEEAI